MTEERIATATNVANMMFLAATVAVSLIGKMQAVDHIVDGEKGKMFGMVTDISGDGNARPRKLTLQWLSSGIKVDVLFRADMEHAISVGLWQPPEEQQDDAYVQRLMEAQKVIYEVNKMTGGLGKREQM